MEDNRRSHNGHAKQKSEQKKDTFRKGKKRAGSRWKNTGN